MLKLNFKKFEGYFLNGVEYYMGNFGQTHSKKSINI